MSITETNSEVAELLEALIEQIEVPESRYRDAKARYEAVGKWLNESDSSLAAYDPDVYPQGSFALGTAVKPLGKEQLDIDAVCLLHIPRHRTTQRDLKRMVGDRLKEHGKYESMLNPKEGCRRCWTVEYADESGFHLDMLPAIPDDPAWLLNLGVKKAHAEHAICITDKETWGMSAEWPRSNPKGYVGWFRDRMKVAYEARRLAVAMRKMAAVESVPDYEVHVPLQRVVQLLKRHRDMKYADDPDKPISIIITTLAAHAYDNEEAVVDALRNIVPRMRSFIQRRADGYWIPNPVNPAENFADKWASSPRKAKVFFEWLDQLESDHQKLLALNDASQIALRLGRAFGEPAAQAAFAKYASRRSGGPFSNVISTGMLRRSVQFNGHRGLFSINHRELPRWQETGTESVVLTCKRTDTDQTVPTDGAALRKRLTLEFGLITTAKAPYDVWWQVVNTGSEATKANDLRGKFVAGDKVRQETTKYTGSHYIECFIVQGRQCVARSGEFLVNIA